MTLANLAYNMDRLIFYERRAATHDSLRIAGTARRTARPARRGGPKVPPRRARRRKSAGRPAKTRR